MVVSFVPWWIVLLWAVFATGFYLVRYRKVQALKNPWLIGGIFAANLFLFAWAVLIFIGLEYFKSKQSKKN